MKRPIHNQEQFELNDLGQFEDLFREYFHPLCTYAVKYTRDFDSAKEIVHNVFVRIWENRNSIRRDQNIRSYLYTSVYNRCLNFIRDHKKNVQLEDHHGEGAGQSGASHLEAEELQARIEVLIQSLPDRCRQIFMLSRYEEKKYSEIASELGISIKTVEVQMSKALKILREHLKEFLMILFILLIL